MIGEYMEKRNMKFIKDSVPTAIVATEDGKRNVTWKNLKNSD